MSWLPIIGYLPEIFAAVKALIALIKELHPKGGVEAKDTITRLTTGLHAAKAGDMEPLIAFHQHVAGSVSQLV